MPPTVFLSYQSASRSKVEAIRQALDVSRITCWMDKRELDKRDLTGSDDWLRNIRQGLENSQLLVLFLTEACEHSSYVTQEVLTAESLGLTLLIVRLEDYVPVGDPLNRVNRFQFLDAFDAPIDNYIDKIVDTVRHKLLQRSQEARREGGKRADLTIGSPVADIGNLVYDAWVDGFLLPTITGLVVKEGHSEGIDRPYTFFDPADEVVFRSADRRSLSSLLEEATGRMAISGERGTGKTILMLQLIQDLVPIAGDINQTRAPLYLNVGSWIDPQKPPEAQPKIRDWIQSRLVKEYHLHSKRAQALSKSTTLIYCFDGLDDILGSHYGEAGDDELTNRQSTDIQFKLVTAFITQLHDLLSDKSQQAVIACGPVVQALLREKGLSLYTLEIKPWSHDDLQAYLKLRGIGALASFIDSHPDIESRLIKSFSELQMLGTIYQAKDRAHGLERSAAKDMEEFFHAIYDYYLQAKYDRYSNDVRIGRKPLAGSFSKDKTARLNTGSSLPVSHMEITEYAPSLASYISQLGQGDAFLLDTLQPDKLPKRLHSLYRWYAGLFIGLGVTLTAGLPVLACIALEGILHDAGLRVTLWHLLLAFLGYILVGSIIGLGYRFSTRWKFGLVVGLAFGVGKGFASGSAFTSPGFTPGWDAGIHNGLAALAVGVPIFAAILRQTKEEPYKIVPTETWEPDASKLIYWMVGAVAVGGLFALALGWAKGLSGAAALGIFAWTRFGKKPRMAPVHVRPNQAIMYSFKNAVFYATLVALTVFAATGISYGVAYGAREGTTAAVMSLASFVCIFFYGGLPVAKHIALRYTLQHDRLVSRHLGLWLEIAVHVGLLKQVGGGYVFSSEAARREYASRWKSKDEPGDGWGESHLKASSPPENMSPSSL